MILDCPACLNQDPEECLTCHGVGTLAIRDAIEVFTIYCRTAYKIREFEKGGLLAPLASVAHTLGLTPQQAKDISTRVRGEIEQYHKIIGSRVGTWQSRKALKGIRVLTHENKIVSI